MVRRIVSLRCNCKCAWILLLDRIDTVGWNGMAWNGMKWDGMGCNRIYKWSQTFIENIGNTMPWATKNNDIMVMFKNETLVSS